jgi:DNA-binding MarR family transcriptional regulator
MATPEDLLQRLFHMTVTLSSAMAQDLAQRGLTQARATLLSVLRDGGPTNQATLARALRVSPRNITGLVNGLEQAGLAARVPHPTDRRATVVVLTDDGARAATALAHDERELAKYLFATCRPAERNAIASTLDVVLARLDHPELEAQRLAAYRRWPLRHPTDHSR